MAYSEEADLLLGDLILSPTLDKQKFIDEAADEINAKLGWLYVLPLAPVGADPVTATSWEDLATHEVLTLKTINNRLASGRLILTLDIAGEGTQLHAYGWYLVREALSDLMAIANGQVDLNAIRVNPVESGYADRTPGITNEDDESLLLGFVNTVHNDTPWFSRPGSIS